jgi:hypothetical protein
MLYVFAIAIKIRKTRVNVERFEPHLKKMSLSASKISISQL